MEQRRRPDPAPACAPPDGRAVELRSRLAWARAPGRALRRLLPWIGPRLDKALRDAVEDWATSRGKILLLAGADPKAESFPDMDLCSRCARIGNAELIEWLCAAGADPDRPGPKLWRPIHHACLKGHRSAIMALRDAGAELGSKVESGFSPILIAARENRIDAINQLCAMGTDVEDTDPKGETALLLCCRRGFEEGAKTLIAHGARVDATERRGFQPIHLAASQGHEAICAMLLDAGADPEAPGPWNKTPANIAKAEGHPAALAAIERAIFERMRSAPPPSEPARAPRRL